MFGINDNDNKKHDATADPGLAPPAVGSAIDAGVMPVDVGSGPIMPTDPLAAPPVDNSVPGPTLPPANQPNPIEAIPSAPVPQTKSSPPSADATMNDDSALPGVNLENAYIPTDPEPKVKKKKGKDDSEQTDDLAGIGLSSSVILDGSDNNELISLKKQALESLEPLVDQLDQTPEEKFKTTMMLIQASDNAKLVPEAYEAANQITDEKARAQALLDVVNEINYFTQPHDTDKNEE